MNEYPPRRAGPRRPGRGRARHLAVPQPAAAQRDRRPDRAEAGLPLRLPGIGHRLQGAGQLPLAHRHAGERGLRHARGRGAALRGGRQAPGRALARLAGVRGATVERLVARAHLARERGLLDDAQQPADLRARLDARAPRSARRRAPAAPAGGRATRAPRAASSRASSRCASTASVPRALAAGRKPVGRRQHRHLQLHRLARAHVARTRAGASAAARAPGSRAAGDAAPARPRTRPAPCSRAAGGTRRAPCRAPTPSWPQNSTRPSALTARVAGLPASCSSAPRRSACPRVSSSASGRRSSAPMRSPSSPNTAAGSRSISTSRSSTSSV